MDSWDAFLPEQHWPVDVSHTAWMMDPLGFAFTEASLADLDLSLFAPMPVDPCSGYVIQATPEDMALPTWLAATEPDTLVLPIVPAEPSPFIRRSSEPIRRHAPTAAAAPAGPAAGGHYGSAALPSSPAADHDNGEMRSNRAFSLGSGLAAAKAAQDKVDPRQPKICACCHIQNTPMWREGRHGTRLCNACGIRWQKYGVSCLDCSYVPRKQERLSNCARCRATLPPPEPTRRQQRSGSASDV